LARLAPVSLQAIDNSMAMSMRRITAKALMAWFAARLDQLDRFMRG